MRTATVLLSSLDRYVPATIQDRRASDSLARARAAVMIATLGISLLCPFIMILALVGFQLTTDADFSGAIMISTIVLGLLFSQHLYFQSYGNLHVTASAYAAQYLASILLSVLYSGGTQSPVLILLACAPMIGYMTMGLKSAQVQLWLIICFMGTLIVMEQQGVTVTNIVTAETASYVHIMSWVLFGIVGALFFTACEYLASTRRKPNLY